MQLTETPKVSAAKCRRWVKHCPLRKWVEFPTLHAGPYIGFDNISVEGSLGKDIITTCSDCTFFGGGASFGIKGGADVSAEAESEVVIAGEDFDVIEIEIQIDGSIGGSAISVSAKNRFGESCGQEDECKISAGAVKIQVVGKATLEILGFDIVPPFSLSHEWEIWEGVTAPCN